MTIKKTTTEFKLTDVFTKSCFGKVESVFLRNFQMQLESTDVRGRQIQTLCSQDCHPDFCTLIRSSKIGAKRCRQDRLRSLNISMETGQPHITLCHAGIVLVCIPIMDRDIALGGLFFGKSLWEKPNQYFEQDVLKRLRGLRLGKNNILGTAEQLPIVSARKIHDASEFLYILLYQTANLDPCVVHWRRQRSEQQSQTSGIILQNKSLQPDHIYPYEQERKLISKVKIGDRTGAREILNNLLGVILFHNPTDKNVLKARLVELLSTLSRAAAEGGVNINRLLSKNLEYINKVLNIDTEEDLCVWISQALNDFIECVYASRDSQKVNQLKSAIDYIETNYQQSITLADVAKVSHLSVSRLAHLFKEQVGITVIDYLTNVRIEHAKRLLLSTEANCVQICFEVGYNNQSYFTRTFKTLVGMTPRQFRQQNVRT